VDNISYIDNDRSACLCGQGGGPYVACVLVAADGSQDLVLVDWELIGDGQHTYNRTPEAVHEQTGPLSPRWAARVHLAPLRCGRPTKAGGRCRVYVSRPGQPCGWHRAAAST
jgi:hypothetical protein